MNARSDPADVSPVEALELVGEVDATAAVEFLRRHFGTFNIMTFRNGRCLRPALPLPEQALAFIKEHAGGDIYFCPADLRDSGFTGKPKKADCRGSRWAWVDI